MHSFFHKTGASQTYDWCWAFRLRCCSCVEVDHGAVRCHHVWCDEHCATPGRGQVGRCWWICQKVCMLRLIWKQFIRWHWWKLWRHFLVRWWGWLILYLLLHWEYKGGQPVGIRYKTVLLRDVSSAYICAKESSSSNAVGIGIIVLFESMTVLHCVRVRNFVEPSWRDRVVHAVHMDMLVSQWHHRSSRNTRGGQRIPAIFVS